MTTGPEPSRRGGKIVVVVVSIVLAAGAVAVGYAVFSRPDSADPTTAPLPVSTAEVTRGTATERLQMPGTLGFEGSYPVIHHGAEGILTAVAGAGTAVGSGGILYSVANQQVRLLLGTIPAYRELAAGMSDGPDVRQLEQGLAGLGMDPGHRMKTDDHFDSATTAAIKRWEAAWGRPSAQRTGKLTLGQIVFHPTELRISQVKADLGTTVGPETPVLAASSTTPAVTAQVAADRRSSVDVGDTVLVSLPGGVPATGKVTAVGRASGDPAATGGPPTVPVTITVDQAGAASDATPVRVAITTAAREGVLLVPVTALLARPGGGYQVRTASGEFLQVQPGLFDETAGLVEVSGAQLAEGTRVQVPST
jgi:hypothetical protein